ncbi:MAG: hypothetical protein F6J86_23975 [Symploca sp. SIO1B1]|nr:hypothetical protein [Symploca sp. SIO1B1]
MIDVGWDLYSGSLSGRITQGTDRYIREEEFFFFPFPLPRNYGQAVLQVSISPWLTKLIEYS